MFCQNMYFRNVGHETARPIWLYKHKSLKAIIFPQPDYLRKLKRYDCANTFIDFAMQIWSKVKLC